MPLKAPRRLPRFLNRQTSLYSRGVARGRYRTIDRRAQRRRERLKRLLRKCARLTGVIASEFRAWLLIGTGILLAAALLVLIFAPFFDVRQIVIHRQDPRIDMEDIQQSLRPLFRQRLLLVTKSQVSALLGNDYPDIDRIDIEKKYPSTLIVSMTMEPIAAEIIIGDSNVAFATQTGATVGSGSYAYITRSGLFISSPIRLTRANSVPTLRLNDWGIRPENRARALPPDFVERIFSARDALRTVFGLTTRDISVYVRAQEFHIRTNRVTLWFDLRSPLSVQLERFREFLKNVPLEQVQQYIDLRIADTIIYQ